MRDKEFWIDLFLYNCPWIEVILLISFSLIYLNEASVDRLHSALFISSVVIFFLITISTIHIFDSGKSYRYIVLKLYSTLKVISYIAFIMILYYTDVLGYVRTLSILNQTFFIVFMIFVGIFNLVFLIFSYMQKNY